MVAPKLNPARERHWVCAQRLRERRRALGLTQREVVARLACRGNTTTNRALSDMENGRGLDLGLLPELAESLTCSVTYLLGLTEDPEDWRPEWCAGSAGDPTIELSGVDASVDNRCGGILGPDVPAGFLAPGRVRKRRTESADRNAESGRKA